MLAAITVVGATQDVGARSVVLTLAYAIGAAVPMLFIAFVGRAGPVRMRSGRTPTRSARRSASSSALTALAIALNVDRHFQTAIPGYTEALQKRVEESDAGPERARAS